MERKGKAQGPSLRTDGCGLGPELTEKAEPQQLLCSRNLGSLKGGLAWGGGERELTLQSTNCEPGMMPEPFHTCSHN